jgi:hypothetical protein
MKAPLIHRHHAPSVNRSESWDLGARSCGFILRGGGGQHCSGSTVPILPGLRRQYRKGVPGGDNYPCWPDKYPASDKFPDFQAAFPEFPAVRPSTTVPWTHKSAPKSIVVRLAVPPGRPAKGRNGRVLGNAGEKTPAAKILTAWISPAAVRATQPSHFLAMRG